MPVCKASDLPAVLLLWPLQKVLEPLNLMVICSLCQGAVACGKVRNAETKVLEVGEHRVNPGAEKEGGARLEKAPVFSHFLLAGCWGWAVSGSTSSSSLTLRAQPC